MYNYLYSVVIPHYNSPRLLKRMLDSIPQRDDIQLIVVDDASSMDNKEQLQNLMHTNLELYFENVNQGPGHARNIGLEHASGKWILVVDADDVFAENAFDVFDKYTDLNIDYLGYCIKCVDTNTLQPNGRKIVSDESVRKYLKMPSDKTLNLYKYKNTVCWNKLVSHSFIKENHIHFETSEVNNDVLYTFQIGLYSKKFKVIGDELYYFAENSDSITHKHRSINREFLFFLQVQKRNGFFKKLGLTHFPFYRRTILYFPYMWKKRGLSDTINFFKMIRERKKEIEEARKAYLYIFQ